MLKVKKVLNILVIAFSLSVTCFALIHAQAPPTQINIRKDMGGAIAKIPPPPLNDTILFQRLYGQVVSKETLQPLAGASIVLDTGRNTGTSTDELGSFSFKKLPVGRHQLRVSYVGYKSYVEHVLLNSTRSGILNIQLEPMAQYLDPIAVHANEELVTTESDPNKINDRDLNRFAGSRGETIRKINVSPGAQTGDDSRNDVIVRGNSPQSVLWRLEGINIPNPNHFNIPGTSGGPVTIINDNMLSNSSFYSGAFPAQYGNTTSGIFDLNLQTGDTTAHNFRGQIGMLGLEGSADGPLSSKHRSSYLVTARQSVLGLFDALNINIGTEWVPYYTDLSFKLNFDVKKDAEFSVFGIGGTSNIDILISQQIDPAANLYGEKDRDQYFKSSMGVVGLSYKKKIDSTGFFSMTLAGSSQYIDSYHNLVYPNPLREQVLDVNGFEGNDTLPTVKVYNFKEKRISLSLVFSQQVKPELYLQAGVTADQYFFHYRDSAMNIVEDDPAFGTWRKRWWAEEDGLLIQPYVQWKYIKDKINLTVGLHNQVFTLTNSVSWIEPRIAFQYNLNQRTIFQAGFGLQSQIQQPYLYFYGSTNDTYGNPVLLNPEMDFTRSSHAVIGMEKLLGTESALPLKVKLETYFQRLYNIPIDADAATSFSLINTGADYRRLAHDGRLTNNGVGNNYGLELTVEKPFARHYLFLITGSLFESKYKGSDDVWRNTDLNGKYILNTLFTKEWSTRRQNIFAAGFRFTTVGGRWYGEEDMEKSNEEKDVVYYDETRNTKQFDPYYRFDFRFSYRVNRKRISYEAAVDIINVFDIQNVLKETYVPYKEINGGTIEVDYQLGILPFFYFRVEM